MAAAHELAGDRQGRALAAQALAKGHVVVVAERAGPGDRLGCLVTTFFSILPTEANAASVGQTAIVDAAGSYFFPIGSTVVGAAAFFGYLGACTPNYPDQSRNPDGSYTSGGVSEYQDAAGVCRPPPSMSTAATLCTETVFTLRRSPVRRATIDGWRRTGPRRATKNFDGVAPNFRPRSRSRPGSPPGGIDPGENHLKGSSSWERHSELEAK